ncbi:MAG: hypothetical protein ABSH52_06685 [Terriglobia bacterium]|jgi:hypothetical protein
MKNEKSAGRKAADTRRKTQNAKWAVTMAKVGIRQAVARAPWPHWQLLTFAGPKGGEARGVVDMIAIRKDHGKAYPGTNRGDTFQIILIQVKGGSAARPTVKDGMRLRSVAQHHGACGILLATWKKGKAARFFSLRAKGGSAERDWEEVADLAEIFG